VLLKRFPTADVSNRVIAVLCVAHGFHDDIGPLQYALGTDSEVAVYPREMLEASLAIVQAREPAALVAYFESIRALPGKIEPWRTAVKK
jgi:hypothetical protein